MEDMIKSITLKIGEQTIELTIEQAQQLNHELKKLLDGGVVYVPYNPAPWRPWWETVTYGSTSATITMLT